MIFHIILREKNRDDRRAAAAAGDNALPSADYIYIYIAGVRIIILLRRHCRRSIRRRTNFP